MTRIKALMRISLGHLTCKKGNAVLPYGLRRRLIKFPWKLQSLSVGLRAPHGSDEGMVKKRQIYSSKRAGGEDMRGFTAAARYL